MNKPLTSGITKKEGENYYSLTFDQSLMIYGLSICNDCTDDELCEMCEQGREDLIIDHKIAARIAVGNLKAEHQEARTVLIMDYKLIDNIEVDGIDTKDYPDFCDAFIASADYDGKPMTDEQLDNLNEDSDFVYECVQNHLF